MRVLHAALHSPDAYLARALEQAGHVVEPAADLADLMLAAADGTYDAVLIEAATAVEVPVRRVAEAAGQAVLVLVLVADAVSGADHARLLRLGADACFVRPVRFMELEARLLALARLGPSTPPQAQASDPAGWAARMTERGVSLSKREHALLDYLSARPGEAVTAEAILEQVWGEAGDHGSDRVRTAVGRLRGKLAAALDEVSIITVHGHGYRLEVKMKQSSFR